MLEEAGIVRLIAQKVSVTGVSRTRLTLGILLSVRELLRAKHVTGVVA